MNHLTHDEFVLSYYGEPELGADREEHLRNCETCRAELSALASVLDQVTPIEVPEPPSDYEARTWDRLQWRLRGERRSSRSRWKTSAAVAAMLTVAFLGGVVWTSRNRSDAPAGVATKTVPAPAAQTSAQQQQSRDRVLLFVVGAHFDESERVLVELTNLTPEGTTDISNARGRAQDLLASNRLYRTSATTRGEEELATLLDELEPVLMQIAHAPDEIGESELRSMQKRVENRGLVFKLRVVRADVHRTARTSSSTSI